MGISFLTPMLLAGTALVVVPIILHLAMRRKPVPHDFPAVRFLREKRVANRRRLRLQHLLLLACRMAAIVLLAFALARPTLRAAGLLGQAEGPVAAALVFDTSPRMLLRRANRTRLDEAATLAKRLIARLPEKSRIAVVDTSGRPAAFASTTTAALAAIDRLKAALPATSLSSAAASAVDLFAETDLLRHELYVFSDLTLAAWERGEPLAATLARHASVSTVVVDVGLPDPENFSIDAVQVPNEPVSAAAPLVLTVERSRLGGQAEKSIAVEFRLPDGGYARRAVKPATWTAAGCEPLSFSIAGLERGPQQGRVVIVGGDDLEVDDQRYFTVQVDTPPKVRVVAAPPPRQNARFLAEAIAPVAIVRDGRQRLDCDVVDVDAFRRESWDDLDGIVLVDPPPFDGQTWGQLEAWVARGRGLVVWLGPRAGSAEAFNSDESRRVLGGGITRIWRDESGENHLAPRALDHPMLAVYRRMAGSVPWQNFPVFRHWEFVSNPTVETDAAPGRGGRGTPAISIVAYRDGTPAVLEHSLGQGRVITITTPASQSASDAEAWNLLPTGFEPWPFVVLANESLLYAMSTREDRNVITGRPATVRVAPGIDGQMLVRSPSGDEFPAAVDPRLRTVTVSATREPGNYELFSGGRREGFRSGFSANFSTADTDCRRLEPDGVSSVFGAETRIARSDEEIVREKNVERVGSELYEWLIVLVAVTMACDWILANRFYAPREGSEPPPRPAEIFVAERNDAMWQEPMEAATVGNDVESGSDTLLIDE